MRQGTPAPAAAINDRGDAWLEPFIAAMHYRAAQQAPVVASTARPDGVARVLDVGGGSGAFAMAFARQQPGLEAVVFDLPNVVPITRRYVAAAGLTARVDDRAAGDYLEDPLPGGFDLVLPLGGRAQQRAGARTRRSCGRARRRSTPAAASRSWTS